MTIYLVKQMVFGPNVEWIMDILIAICSTREAAFTFQSHNNNSFITSVETDEGMENEVLISNIRTN